MNGELEARGFAFAFSAILVFNFRFEMFTLGIHVSLFAGYVNGGVIKRAANW